MEWIRVEDFDFTESKCVHIDTRDFHAVDGGFIMPFSHKEVKRMNEEWFLSDEKVKKLMLEIKGYSGGDSEWRMLSFDSINCDGWQVKYFRLYKTKRGWVICNSKRKPILPITLCEERLNKKHLHAH